MCKNIISIQSKQAIVTMYKSGISVKGISEMTGIHVQSVEYYVRNFKKSNPGFKSPRELERLNQEKRLCELYKSGITVRKELARESGLPYGSIDYILGKWGVSIAAKEARRNAGEIPSELMKPVLDWLTNHAAADVAEKMADFAKSLTA